MENYSRAYALETVPGVGPALVQRLAKLGIRDLRDALFHLPLRYQDRTRVFPIGGLRPGLEVVINAKVEHTAVMFKGRRSLQCYVSDGTGGLLLRFFHFRNSLQDRLQKGSELLLFGELRAGRAGLEMVHPEFMEKSALDGSLTPIYPATEGLQQLRLRRLIHTALDRCLNTPGLVDLLPIELLEKHAFPSLADSLMLLHKPPVGMDLQELQSAEHPAMQRLILEELLAHHLGLLRLRAQGQAYAAPVLQDKKQLLTRFADIVLFEPTTAQQRVASEIANDLVLAKPMLRLVQGDVGSGKTWVAATAVLRAVASGYQAAIMAPTEILAEQHLQSFMQWLQPLGIAMVFLSSRLGAKAKRESLEKILAGVPVIVGTHALFQTDVVFSRLGLVVVDEQHRFGVHQRLALKEKGVDKQTHPHQLILTATPIPRTLAMTAYADLDVSVIDELPKGRKPVTTAVMSGVRRADVVARIEVACKSGQQAYWVCTLIEESELLQCQAAEDTAVMLQQALPELSIVLVHGRMKSKDKQQIMIDFKHGAIDVLVATTVIEVGVDVPNASLMVIENAERLGLSQLHQLRGRVGRGAQQSSCILLYQSPLGKIAKQRLQIIRDSNDGFEIAEKDLQIRGPGEVLGTRQTGQLVFRIADLQRDAGLLAEVHQLGNVMLEQHPTAAQELINRWMHSGEDYARV